MRKFFILGAAFVISLAMLMTACKKDSPKLDNGGNNNQETPSGGDEGGEGGGGGDVTPNQEYPETAVVLPQAVTDIDGNSYDAVQIGNQVWMAENLRTTKYADGTAISLGSLTSTTTAYRYAPGSTQSNNGNMTNVARYGYLYNWPAVMHGASSSNSNPSHVQGICPTGWHVPSDAEWTELTDYMSTQSAYTASGNAYHLAKALAATWGWNSSSETDAPGNTPSTNNATGFSALPAGNFSGYYGYFGHETYFWSATEGSDNLVCRRILSADYSGVLKGSGSKNFGFSVRCVRD